MILPVPFVMGVVGVNGEGGSSESGVAAVIMTGGGGM